MISSIRNKPIYRIFIWLAFFACILIIYNIVSSQGSTLISYGDTVNYWAAGRLMLSGGNPYSIDEVLKLQLAAGKPAAIETNAISMMLYPPWTIPFTLPLGLFDYPLSRVVWLLLHICLLIISAKLIWELYGGSNKRLYIPYLTAIVFAPTLPHLGIGHITTLLLIGVVGFLICIQNSKRNQWYLLLAGVSASLALLKPQILYLFIFALFIWIIRNRSWLVFLGGALFIILLNLVSLVLNPQVINQYLESLSIYPLGIWATPTIGMFLRLLFGYENEWLQILPTLVGIAWFMIYWRKHYKTWDWLEQIPLLLLVCVVTSPYTWTSDMVVLLIPVIAMMANISRNNINWQSAVYISIFILLNFINLYFHRNFEDLWFVWFAPALLIWYLIGQKIIKKNTDVPEIVDQDFAQAAPN